jgi:hypothetical protein
MAKASCFISYAWQNDSHRAWTEALAKRIRECEVQVYFDRWDCPVGCDLARFMQHSIARSDYVLVICTPEYAKKADAGRGGVGQEATIMYGELLTDSESTDRFLPLLRDGGAADALPAYLKTRHYIDFRPDRNQDQAFEQLCLRLFSESSSVAEKTFHPLRPIRWIRVTGTGDTSRIEPAVENTARTIGECLADARFGLITGGWPGIDRIVANAFRARLQSSQVPVEDFLTQFCDIGRGNAFPEGRIIQVDTSQIGYTESALYSDACILLAGLGGALQTALWMRHAGKPVLPLPETGSDAKEFWYIINELWTDDLLPGVSRQEFQRLARPLPGAGREAVNLLLKWAGRPTLRTHL